MTLKYRLSSSLALTGDRGYTSKASEDRLTLRARTVVRADAALVHVYGVRSETLVRPEARGAHFTRNARILLAQTRLAHFNLVHATHVRPKSLAALGHCPAQLATF